MSTNGSYISII